MLQGFWAFPMLIPQTNRDNGGVTWAAARPLCLRSSLRLAAPSPDSAAPVRLEAEGPLGCGCQNRFGIPVLGLVNSPPILEPVLVVGLVDVHWGYDLDFDPCPLEAAQN